MRSIILFCLFFLLLFNGCSKSPEEAFKEARQINNVQAYEDFLKKYSDSEYSVEAKSLLYGLQFEKAKKDNTIKAYEDFLANCPESNFATEAQNNLNALYDEAVKAILASINESNRGKPFSVKFKNFDPSTGTLNITYKVPGFRAGSALLGMFLADQSISDIVRVEQQQKEINSKWVTGNNEYIKQNLPFVKELKFKIYTN